MGGRGASGGALQKIAHNPNWLYQPDEQTDLSDLRKNPIPFVGLEKDYKLGYEIEEGTTQTKYESKVSIDISKLETLQPFVLQSGISNYQRYDYTDTPYVVAYQGHYYLMDGNHRVAIAKLNGQKKVVVDISHRKKK